jgi:hypothetical protein
MVVVNDRILRISFTMVVMKCKASYTIGVNGYRARLSYSIVIHMCTIVYGRGWWTWGSDNYFWLFCAIWCYSSFLFLLTSWSDSCFWFFCVMLFLIFFFLQVDQITTFDFSARCYSTFFFLTKLWLKNYLWLLVHVRIRYMKNYRSWMT